MEMDRFFRGYKSEILKSCEELIANHNKKEALALMELWSRLIPEDDDIQEHYIWQKQCVHVRRAR